MCLSDGGVVEAQIGWDSDLCTVRRHPPLLRVSALFSCTFAQLKNKPRRCSSQPAIVRFSQHDEIVQKQIKLCLQHALSVCVATSRRGQRRCVCGLRPPYKIGATRQPTPSIFLFYLEIACVSLQVFRKRDHVDSHPLQFRCFCCLLNVDCNILMSINLSLTHHAHTKLLCADRRC